MTLLEKKSIPKFNLLPGYQLSVNSYQLSVISYQLSWQFIID
jgi:hypothetical protein